MVNSQTNITSRQVVNCVTRFRKKRPHVHCLTNTVAQNFTANVLLAAGATPSMTIAVQEIEDFVTMADGLLINLGTMDAGRSKAVEIAVSAAIEQGKPWALDPVFVQASPLRLALAKALLKKQPSVVRCNSGEAEALFGTAVNETSLQALANQSATTIALTGTVDRIGNEFGLCHLSNGSAMMENITAMGCALTALIVGFLAVEDDHLLATTAAVSLYGVAGERAQTLSTGPGTFMPHFLDALANLSENEIEAGVRL